MRTLYQILELEAAASAADIKSAYKRLAFAHHPDRNAGSPYHEERFKEIAHAYSILSDADRRALYDYRSRAHYQVEPLVQTQATATQHASPFEEGPTPYGGFYSYHGRQAGQQSRPAFVPGRNLAQYASPHHIFIGIFFLACFGMSAVWFGQLMNRKTARQFLREGDFYMALDYDSTYGDAWMARARAAFYGNRPDRALYYGERAIIMADQVPGSWHLFLGNIYLEDVQQSKQAKAHITQAIRLGGPSTADSARLALVKHALERGQPVAPLVPLIEACSPTSLTGVSEALAAGRVYLAMGNPIRAGAFGRAALSGGKPSGLAYYLQGEGELATGDTLLASYAFDQALNHGYEPALARLRTLRSNTTITQ